MQMWLGGVNMSDRKEVAYNGNKTANWSGPYAPKTIELCQNDNDTDFAGLGINGHDFGIVKETGKYTTTTIDLSDGSYISDIKMRYDKKSKMQRSFIYGIRLTIKKFGEDGSKIVEVGKVDNDYAETIELNNIRVTSMSASRISFGMMDGLKLGYIENYQESKKVTKGEVDSSLSDNEKSDVIFTFIGGYDPPNTTITEYTTINKSKLHAFESVVEKTETMEFSASVQAEFIATVSSEFGYEMTTSSRTTMVSEMESHFSKEDGKERNIGSGEVGVRLFTAHLYHNSKDAQDEAWPRPIAAETVTTMEISDKAPFLGCFDLTGDLHTQVVGLKKHKIERFGMVYYQHEEVGS